MSVQRITITADAAMKMLYAMMIHNTLMRPNDIMQSRQSVEIHQAACTVIALWCTIPISTTAVLAADAAGTWLLVIKH